MKDTYVRVKGIVKRGDTYLLLKRWVDDRIPDPFVWEFIDAEVPHGEAPDEPMLDAVARKSSTPGRSSSARRTVSGSRTSVLSRRMRRRLSSCRRITGATSG